jgi:hypothetical protein
MKRPLKLSDILGESKFKKVNMIQLLAFALGGSATFLGYILTDVYLDRSTIIGVFLTLQIIIAIILNWANPIGSAEISVNRFLATLFLPVTLAPIACIYLDRIQLKKVEGVAGVIEEKRVIRGGGKYSKGQRRVLTITTEKERIEKAVLWSFYDLVEVGDTVGIDIEKGLIGFRKVSDYSKM